MARSRGGGLTGADLPTGDEAAVAGVSEPAASLPSQLLFVGGGRAHNPRQQLNVIGMQGRPSKAGGHASAPATMLTLPAACRRRQRRRQLQWMKAAGGGSIDSAEPI